MNYDEEKLASLLARCTLRDQQALKGLYEAVGSYLNAVAYRILRQDDAANDALQEAFIQIWENAHQYQAHKAKPLTWMTSIVRYRALDRLTKEKRIHAKVTTDEIAYVNAPDTTPTPEEQTSSGQNQRHIHECLAQLNQKIGECIHLAYIHGYSREELAQRFDANVNTVKSWLKRGSERLKLCLETKLAASQ